MAEATRALGGLGFFVRADRSIWTFVDGQPLLVRRGEHWTAFPLELTAAIANMIGGGAAARLVARAAFIISAQPQGAILAIVDDAAALDGVVSPKDRYDLRDAIDPTAMRHRDPAAPPHRRRASSTSDTLARLAGARRRHRGRPRRAAARLRRHRHQRGQPARGRPHGGGQDAVPDGAGRAQGVGRRRHHGVPGRAGREHAPGDGVRDAVTTAPALDIRLPGGLVEGDGTLTEARTMAFTTLVIAQLFNCFNARSDRVSAFHHLFTNRLLWATIGLSLLLQVAVVTVPFLNDAFDTTALDTRDWVLCVALASTVLWADEVRKLVQRVVRR